MADPREILARIRKQADAAIPGFPGYYVTSEGRVFSRLDWRGYGVREVTPVEGKGGYLKVRLRAPGGARVNRAVHRLVAESFLGPRPAGFQIRHLNGNHTDNRADNLAWGTAAENASDRDVHGTTAKGSRNGYARLSEGDIPHIRSLLRGGMSQREVARRYGVSQSAIYSINVGRTWSHVA